jgi:hypothetical protein
MLTRPSTDKAQGEADRIVFAIDSDIELNSSHTGGVLLVDTGSGDVEMVLPDIDEAGGSVIYIMVVCGANTLTVVAHEGDSVADDYGFSTSTQWSHLTLTAGSNNNWTVKMSSGDWAVESTTT